MNKLWKKLMAAVCCTTLVIGLSACGAKDSPAADKGSQAAEDAGKESMAENTGDSLLTEPGTYPIVTEPVTLKIMIMSKPYIEDYNTNDFTKYMEDLTGINLEIEAVSYEDSQEKINLAMAGGDYPDVFMTLEPDVVKYGVKEGMLIPLDDLIEKNMPNFMANASYTLDSIRQSDGKIYGLPSINEAYHVMYGNKMWMNSYKLNEMGLSVPTTTQEFYDVCKAYLEKNPNGVAIGDMNDNAAINWLMNAFILTPDDPHGSHDKTNSAKCIVSPDGKVISAATQPQFKEGLKYIKSLYDMGAFYEGNFSNTEDGLRSLINQDGEPVLFFPHLYSAKYIDSTASNEMYRHYEALSPVEGPEGVRVTPYYYNDGLYENRFVITDKCENPEVALRFIDWFYQPKSYVMAQYGTEEGVDYIYDEEGVFTLQEGKYNFNYNEWQIGQSYSPDFTRALYNRNEAGEKQKESQSVVFAADREAEISPVTGFTFDPTPVKTQLANCASITTEMIPALSSGSVDPKKALPEFLQRLETAGVNDIIAEKQKQLDAWKAAN